MGRGDQPKHRQLKREEKRSARKRAPFQRILIVTEDSKSAAYYLREICRAERPQCASVVVQPSTLGTAATQIVESARQILVEGNPHRSIPPGAFDQVFAVFDRDTPANYDKALAQVSTLDRKFRNDEKQPVSFKAIVANPCFELWLLLHFEDVLAPINASEAFHRLQARYPAYTKSLQGTYAHTRQSFDIASKRAKALAVTPDGPHTNFHELVDLLTGLKA